MKRISSSQNPIVKKIIELKSKASKRREELLCVIEGLKEIEIAMASQIDIETLLINEANQIEWESIDFLKKIDDVLSCSQDIFDKIALRDTKMQYIAIAKTRYYTLVDIHLSPNPFILILENIEKPGNLGALFRTCDAAGVDAILCTSMQTDLYNPNVIRNSLGCVFSQKIVFCTNEEAKNFCKSNSITTYSTYLHTTQTYYSKNFKEPTAIVMGNEGHGISEFWTKDPEQLVKIPMLGHIDSMNVSNSASIMLYEVVRQRRSDL